MHISSAPQHESAQRVPSHSATHWSSSQTSSWAQHSLDGPHGARHASTVPPSRVPSKTHCWSMQISSSAQSRSSVHVCSGALQAQVMAKSMRRTCGIVRERGFRSLEFFTRRDLGRTLDTTTHLEVSFKWRDGSKWTTILVEATCSGSEAKPYTRRSRGPN